MTSDHSTSLGATDPLSVTPDRPADLIRDLPRDLLPDLPPDLPPGRPFAWGDFLARAELYPSHLDLKEGKLVLARMTRDGYRSVNFLGAEVERVAVQQREVAVGELLRRRRATAIHHQPFRAVFHTAFCGSTLLSRALDALGAFVLKEPQILVEICGLRRSAQPSAPGWVERMKARFKQETSRLIGSGVIRSNRWSRNMQAAVLDLLARPFHGHEPVVVKMNDGCNELMAELTPQAGLFLHGTLTEFLTAVLKSPDRREWMKRRFHYFERVARRLGVLPESEPAPTTDHRKAAMLWATYIKLFCAAAAGGKLRALSCTALMNDPAAAVARVCDYFKMPIPDSAIQAVVNSDVFQFHAKNRTKRFDRRDRSVLNAGLREQFRAEIDEAISWVTRFCEPDLPLPCPLAV